VEPNAADLSSRERAEEAAGRRLLNGRGEIALFSLRVPEGYNYANGSAAGRQVTA
jgi:hypothetical protein